jgi:hypothetical protein
LVAPAPSNSSWSRLVSGTPSRSSPALTGGQPRPMNGISVAVMVMNCTLASSGSEAM